MAIKLLIKKYTDLNTIVVVPTDLLKGQWEAKLAEEQLNARVFVINTAIKQNLECDLLICDEIHRFAAETFSKIFKTVKFRFVLGLTATLERLDNRHIIIEKYCPTCDVLTAVEAVSQGWLATNVEYKVIIQPDDLEQYLRADKEFQEHFEFFGRDFTLAMSMVGPKGFIKRNQYKELMLKMIPGQSPSEVYKAITYHATALMKALQKRKAYIYDHPKKIELTKQIINARPDSKIITFSSTIKNAEAIGIGEVYSGKNSKKQGAKVLDKFSQQQSGVLNTVKKANEGADIPGLNCAIILAQDSSKTTFIQRLGRCIRKEGDKVAEIFTFVLAGTIEECWFNKSHEGQEYICIDEANLQKVLLHLPYETYKAPSPKFKFRF